MVLDNLISWDSYSSHMKTSLHKMMMAEQLTDVTLVSADQTKIKAHKNILSACSEGFSNIFNDHDVHSHTVIYLKGIKDKILRYILEYMYSGETRINLDCLGDFLSVAKELEICELHENNKQSDESHEEEVTINEEDSVKHETPVTNSLNEQNMEEPKMEKRKKFPCLLCREKGKNKSYKTKLYLTDHMHRMHREKNIFCDQCEFKCSRYNLLNVHMKNAHGKQEPIVKDKHTVAKPKQNKLNNDINIAEEITEYSKDNRKFACSLCDFKGETSASLKVHFRSMHEENNSMDFPCVEKDCAYAGPSNNALKYHINSVHLGIRYPCSICLKTFSEKNHVKRHYENVHLIKK